MRVVRVCRLFSLLLMGLKIVHVPIAMQTHVEMHLEYISDLLIHGVMGQLRWRELLSDRIVSVSAFTFMYKALDMSHPALRAVALSLNSMCVGLALDACNRAMFTCATKRRKQSATKCGLGASSRVMHLRQKASHTKCE